MYRHYVGCPTLRDFRRVGVPAADTLLPDENRTCGCTGGGERTAEDGASNQKSLLVPAAEMPTLRTSRRVGQPTCDGSANSKMGQRYPRLAPWAAFFRRFAALITVWFRRACGTRFIGGHAVPSSELAGYCRASLSGRVSGVSRQHLRGAAKLWYRRQDFGDGRFLHGPPSHFSRNRLPSFAIFATSNRYGG